LIKAYPIGPQRTRPRDKKRNVPRLHYIKPLVGGPMEKLNAQPEEILIRRLQIMIGMVMSVIHQDPNLTVEDAADLAAGAKRAALAMFPDKELAYDLIYRPRLQRLINERFRLQ
jgi:hypothetical protein